MMLILLIMFHVNQFPKILKCIPFFGVDTINIDFGGFLMKDYRLYDMSDFFGFRLCNSNRIGSYETVAEAKAAAAKYYLECDGECDIFICKRNPATGTFLAIDAEEFEFDV